METIYNQIKMQCDLPCANLTYITLIDNLYRFFAQPISLRETDKEKTISQLKEISEKTGFFAFAHSDKGKKFIETHKEEIAKCLTATFFGVEGLGKVCKN